MLVCVGKINGSFFGNSGSLVAKIGSDGSEECGICKKF